jgi:peptide/nickel transport system permease protein
MLRYVVRRIIVACGMLVGLSLIIFLLLRLTPGDPVSAYIDPTAPMSEADISALRHRLGLDASLPTQYLHWAGEALQGDLGYSSQHTRAPVTELIAERAGPTVLLMGAGIGLATVLGLALGVIAGMRPGGGIDIALGAVGSLGISSPAFLTALLGLFLFAVRLGWAPAGGMSTPGIPVTVGDVLAHLALPACILAVAQTMLTMRYMRGSLLEAMVQDYVRTARAKGLREARVVLRHAARNALLPVVTLIGATVGAAVGGAVFIESVFNWPGMGLLLVDAVESRDYPLILGTSLVIGAGVLAVNLSTDLVYVAIDPRIRLD